MQTTVPPSRGRGDSRDNSADNKPSAAGASTKFTDASSSSSSSASSDMATTSSAGHIEIETIESVDDDIDPDTPDECHTATAAAGGGVPGTKSDENEDLATSGDESELDPLQSTMSKADNDNKDAASQNACLELGDDETWSKDFDRDSQSPTSRKKGWDVRCFVIGFLVLLLVVGGASVIVLAHRFKGETVYDFHFASYYGDHMVLQRAPHQAVIWGYGPIVADNTSVVVVLERSEKSNRDYWRQEYRTTVGKTNAGPVWRVLVGPISHPGPYVITASLEGIEGYKIELKDVLFGDIWVCVEQNKIHLSVSKLMNGTEEGQDSSQSRYQDIRIFSLFPAKSDMLWYDLRGIQLPWTVPKSVMDVRISLSHANLHFPGICWLFGRQLHARLQYPIGLVSVTYSDSVMEEWVPSSVNDKCGIAYTDSSSRIWNGMIHPMLDMQVFGLIWHQGDLDAYEVLNNYDCALIEFIRHWRQEVFDRAGGSSDILLPVGIIQLTAKSVSNPHNTYGYSDIRWKQTANYGYLPNDLMPATFLAVTIDLPETTSNHTSLHTGHKHDIVNRLVHGAMSVAYKRSHGRLEPFPDTYSAGKGSLTLTFKSPRIAVRNNNGFEICCSKNRTDHCPIRNGDIENKQEWLSAPIIESKSTSTSVTLTTTACSDRIVAVRYAWREAPCSLKNCAIYGAELNFPMSPYIRFNLTDDGVRRVLGTDQARIL